MLFGLHQTIWKCIYLFSTIFAYKNWTKRTAETWSAMIVSTHMMYTIMNFPNTYKSDQKRQSKTSQTENSRKRQRDNKIQPTKPDERRKIDIQGSRYKKVVNKKVVTYRPQYVFEERKNRLKSIDRRRHTNTLIPTPDKFSPFNDMFELENGESENGKIKISKRRNVSKV